MCIETALARLVQPGSICRAGFESVSTPEGEKKLRLKLVAGDRAEVERLLREGPSATTGESKAFRFKMKGDYWRYLAEFATGAGRGALTRCLQVVTK